MKSRQTTLSDIIGKKISILGKTFTADWIDAPGQPDNGKIMVQSDETEIYYVGEKSASIYYAAAEILSELRKEAKRKLNGVHGKEVIE